jgi:hypothetical protein
MAEIGGAEIRPGASTASIFKAAKRAHENLKKRVGVRSLYTPGGVAQCVKKFGLGAVDEATYSYYIATVDFSSPDALEKIDSVKLSPKKEDGAPKTPRCQAGAPKRSHAKSRLPADESSDETESYDYDERKSSARRNLFGTSNGAQNICEARYVEEGTDGECGGAITNGVVDEAEASFNKYVVKLRLPSSAKGARNVDTTTAKNKKKRPRAESSTVEVESLSNATKVHCKSNANPWDALAVFENVVEDAADARGAPSEAAGEPDLFHDLELLHPFDLGTCQESRPIDDGMYSDFVQPNGASFDRLGNLDRFFDKSH